MFRSTTTLRSVAPDSRSLRLKAQARTSLYVPELEHPDKGAKQNMLADM